MEITVEITLKLGRNLESGNLEITWKSGNHVEIWKSRGNLEITYTHETLVSDPSHCIVLSLPLVLIHSVGRLLPWVFHMVCVRHGLSGLLL